MDTYTSKDGSIFNLANNDFSEVYKLPWDEKEEFFKERAKMKARERAKKWYQDNKELKKEYDKENYQKTLQRLREKVTCEVCQCKLSRSSLSMHRKTKKHQTNVSKITLQN